MGMQLHHINGFTSVGQQSESWETFPVHFLPKLGKRGPMQQAGCCDFYFFFWSAWKQAFSM